VRTWQRGSTTRRRGVAVSLGLLAAGGIALSTGVAGAAPQPTVTQVQQRLSQLNSQVERLDQQYDLLSQQLSAARQQLSLVDNEAARYRARFSFLRKQVAQIAATAYMDGSLSSPEALFISADPQQILDESSILIELSDSNSNQMNEFLSAARQLTGALQSARRTTDAITALRDKMASEKRTLEKNISQQQVLLAQLTPAQRATAGPGGGTGGGTGGGGGGSIGGHDPLPTSTQAEKAVQFAYDQLGCIYVFGGTGPCNQGFDCSGLTQAAWAYAGVSIPRTSFEQWDGLPHVPTSDIQPGDILVFLSEGHVGIYVGGGMLIDAPHTGAVVEKVAFSGWYTANFDGALRP
jgi:peptidoglycan DL-endopeptidase CwlO